MTDPTLRVNEVEGGPVVIGERPPYREAVVDRDRIVDPPSVHRPPHVLEVALKLELGSVHANRHEALIPVALRPGPEVRLCAQPVDARVGPELDDDDMPTQTAGRQRLRIEPSLRAVERRQHAFKR